MIFWLAKAHFNEKFNLTIKYFYGKFCLTLSRAIVKKNSFSDE